MEDSHISRVSDNIRSRLHGVPSPDLEFSIFRVRSTLHSEHHGAYIPHKVSIGPLHHGNKALQEMESHKNSYLHSFLKRNPDMFLEDYLKAIKGLQADTRRCYEEEIHLNDDQLSEMMLVDGCFVIELLVRYFKIEGAQISPNDPVFGNLELLNHIRLDLMVLENQLPFFVLQCLFNVSTVFNKSVPLVELALGFFNNIVPGHKRLGGINAPEVKHLLDLLRRSYAPLSPIEELHVHGHDDVPKVLKFGASKLQEVGSVSFKKCKSRKLLDIKFHLNGVMEIPVLKIQEETECLMRNFIAFEQSCGGLNTFMSNYMCFMASLMNSRDDVNLLRNSGVLETDGISNDRVIRLFEALTDEVMIINGRHFSRLCKKVEIHCDTSWRLWLASTCRALSSFIALMVQQVYQYHFHMSDWRLGLSRIIRDLGVPLLVLVVVVLIFRSRLWLVSICLTFIAHMSDWILWLAINSLYLILWLARLSLDLILCYALLAFIAQTVPVYHYPMSDWRFWLDQMSRDLGASVHAPIPLIVLVGVILVFVFRMISFRSGILIIGMCAFRFCKSNRVWNRYFPNY